MKRSLIIILVLVIIGGASFYYLSNSQQDQQTNVTPTPASDLSDDTSQMVEYPDDEVRLQAQNAVRAAVASETGTDPDLVDITMMEEREWPNGCLGLEGPDEMCTEALVNGYLFQAVAEGQTFTYRTNFNGTSIRQEK